MKSFSYRNLSVPCNQEPSPRQHPEEDTGCVTAMLMPQQVQPSATAKSVKNKESIHELYRAFREELLS
ncbi:MAG: hypothetical protein ACOVRB_12400 [Akkermansiaceae bacterium]